MKNGMTFEIIYIEDKKNMISDFPLLLLALNWAVPLLIKIFRFCMSRVLNASLYSHPIWFRSVLTWRSRLINVCHSLKIDSSCSQWGFIYAKNQCWLPYLIITYNCIVKLVSLICGPENTSMIANPSWSTENHQNFIWKTLSPHSKFVALCVSSASLFLF